MVRVFATVGIYSLLVLSISFLVAEFASAESSEMVPLSKYLNEATSDGPLEMVEVRYFNLRCLGVLGMTSIATSDNTQASAVELRQRVQNATTFHTAAFQRAHKILQPDDTEFRFFQTNFKLVLELYADRAQRSRAATGMIFTDELLRDDLNLCLDSAETISR